MFFQQFFCLIQNVRTVLDLGGGHGYFCQRLLEMSENIRVTIYDLPEVVAYCRRKFESSPLLPLRRWVSKKWLRVTSTIYSTRPRRRWSRSIPTAMRPYRRK